jgi:hypothetical protein
VLFEGGAAPATALEADFLAVREAAAADAVERLLALRDAGAVDRVLVVTNRPALAREASALGARVDLDAGRGRFHFGQRLASLIRRERLERVLVLGGGAAALLPSARLADVARALADRPRVVVVNNPVSPDVVGVSPAERILDLPPPPSDNALGRLLLESDLPRLVLDPEPAVSFDLDTPADCAVLAGEAAAGPRTRRALDGCAWVGRIARRLEGVVRALATPGAGVAVLGRAGSPVTDYIERRLPCRLRLVSEQRGMRARGEAAAASLAGALLDELGPERFLTQIARVAEAVVWDTRVVFAHWGARVSRADRFRADAGMVDQVEDPRVRRLAAAVWDGPVAAVAGGHNLVHGGLWCLAVRAEALAAGGPGPET